MRRALIGIVPDEILERRRKAFQLSAPLKAIAMARSVIEDLFRDSSLARLGLVDAQAIHKWVRTTSEGDPLWWQALCRAIALELWLRTSNEDDRPPFSQKEFYDTHQV